MCEYCSGEESFLNIIVENFFVKDGEKVQCAWGGDRGSRTLGISVVEPITKAYWVGKELLFVKQVDLTEIQLVVQSTDGVYYIFERIQ